MALKLSEGRFPAEVVGGAKAAEFTLTETAYAARHRIPKHSHDRACFVVVLRGTFSEVYEGRRRACEPLMLIYRPPHETHWDHFDEQGARCLNVEVAEPWLRRVGAHSRALDDSADFRGGPFSQLAARLHREYRRMDEASALAIEGLLLEIVAEATRRSAPTPPRGRPRWLSRAEEMIRAQFREPLTLTDIAAAVGAHPVHLSAVFHKTYGCTVGEYVRRLRVEFASGELSASDAPIIKIALAAGFYDQSHFSRTFKRHTGSTPAAYRSMFRAT
jgi:AraC family transcriptional regulator